MEFVKVTIKDETKEYESGTSILEIANEYQSLYDEDIILAVWDHKLRELHHKITHDGELEFLTVVDKNGRKAYRRSVVFLMQKAMQDLTPDEQVDIRVNYALGQGYYCTLKGKEVTEAFLSQLKEKMLELTAENLPLNKYATKTKTARKMFADMEMTDKERLLKYRLSSNINIYDLDGVVDYFYGYMAPSTKYLKYFDIKLFDEGFMLLFPGAKGKEVAEFVPSMHLFETLKESSRWANMMEIPTVGALNDAIAAGKTQEIILMQEALMEQRFGDLAEEIAKRENCKFVMIAGPSSSGKTTFSHRLSTQLRAKGLHPHPLALDNYYLNRDQIPLDEFGEKDFECIEGLDIELFNQNMSDLLAGKEVEIPHFNFVTGKREAKGEMMKLGVDDVLVIEGIHGLNSRMSYSLPKESKFKIYISALTQLSIDEHNPLPTTDGRLIRRIVRDSRTRGTSAEETIAMWDSVRRGEEKNIFPFQDQADAMINSALIYEMAVLKMYAMPQLFAVPETSPQYAEAMRLLKLLDYFLPMPTEGIGQTSIVREFIGGGCFLD